MFRYKAVACFAAATMLVLTGCKTTSTADRNAANAKAAAALSSSAVVCSGPIGGYNAYVTFENDAPVDYRWNDYVATNTAHSGGVLMFDAAHYMIDSVSADKQSMTGKFTLRGRTNPLNLTCTAPVELSPLAAGTALNGQEVAALYTSGEAKTFTGFALERGNRWQVDVDGKGVQKLTIPGSEFSDTGTYSVDGSKVCSQWREVRNGREICFTIARQADGTLHSSNADNGKLASVNVKVQ